MKSSLSLKSSHIMRVMHRKSVTFQSLRKLMENFRLLFAQLQPFSLIQENQRK